MEDPKSDARMHKLLPIGNNEKILRTIRHHWFAYVSVYFGAGCLCLLILAGIIALVASQRSLGFNSTASTGIIVAGVILMGLVVAFSFIPVWIKKQEMLVLTEEAILQIKKPSLFANKVSQLNLQHIADVTVDQDTLGTMFGYGGIVIETPGEQDDYQFNVIGDPRGVAKAIIDAHENYSAALESGQIQTTLGVRPPMPGTTWRQDATVADSSQPQTPPQIVPPSPVPIDQPSPTLPVDDQVDPNKLKES